MGCRNVTNSPGLTSRAILRALLAAACLMSVAALAGELPTKPVKIPAEVDAYARELKTISNNPRASGGVEGLFRLGEQAANALVVPVPPSEGDILEDLSDEDFEVVVRKMKGFMVNREETVFVEPDPAFFLALAKRAGDQASVEFFEAYRKTRPDAWPVYIDRQTDYGGCIRFGTSSLVDTYKLWDGYGRNYPARYPQQVGSFIWDIEHKLTEGTCACEDNKSVLREFNAFIQAFPKAKITARLRDRIEQIQHGKSDMQEQCVSG